MPLSWLQNSLTLGLLEYNMITEEVSPAWLQEIRCSWDAKYSKDSLTIAIWGQFELTTVFLHFWVPPKTCPHVQRILVSWTPWLACQPLGTLRPQHSRNGDNMLGHSRVLCVHTQNYTNAVLIKAMRLVLTMLRNQWKSRTGIVSVFGQLWSKLYSFLEAGMANAKPSGVSS